VGHVGVFEEGLDRIRAFRSRLFCVVWRQVVSCEVANACWRAELVANQERSFSTV